MTIVELGDLPESQVSIPELSELAHKWPPAVINHMWWRQPELEEMKQAARVQYRKKQPAPCEFCGTLIRCTDMWHAATWIWLSCGDARCRGVPSGRVRHRT